MGRISLIVATVAIVFTAASCIPSDPGPTGLYLGIQSDITPIVTPQRQPETFGFAPPIDEHYGGIVYEGSAGRMQDPRPPLENGLERLRFWVAKPDNNLTDRPAIVWVHGGGFATGLNGMYGLAQDPGSAYAKRGYVNFAMEYRIDTTLSPDQNAGRPVALCQWVQDHQADPPPGFDALNAQCMRNVATAQHDILASVRYIRLHAAEYGIDPAKVVVAGFSAGGVTAANTAYQSEDVGNISYFPGDTKSPADSKPQAVIAASGCAVGLDDGVPSSIDPTDAPVSIIQSRYDQALDWECVTSTVGAARQAGLVAELELYCDEGGHAKSLYDQHKVVTDEQWTIFMARELHLYSGLSNSPEHQDLTCP